MYIGNTVQVAKENANFRKVIYTGTHSQYVVMSLLAGEDIGSEVHPKTDQVLVIVEGQANVVIDGETKAVAVNDLIFVPAGAEHNVINTGAQPLKLFTVYAPPAHKDGTVHTTKAEAEKEEEY